jgi:hypothetical protein
MEMKVRLLDGSEEKGVAQVEQELLEQHEQQQVQEIVQEQVVEDMVTSEPEKPKRKKKKPHQMGEVPPFFWYRPLSGSPDPIRERVEK